MSGIELTWTSKQGAENIQETQPWPSTSALILENYLQLENIKFDKT